MPVLSVLPSLLSLSLITHSRLLIFCSSQDNVLLAGNTLVDLQQFDEQIEEQIETTIFAPIRKV